MSFIWNHVETNRPQSDLTVVTANDCTFESTMPMTFMPDPFDATDFQETDFMYSLFGFENTGSGEADWILNEFNYGIYNTLRDGIGFFYFYAPIPPYFSDERIDGFDGCVEDDFERVKFWDYLSTFWNFLSDSSRSMFENMWFGFVMAGGSLSKKSSRFLDAVNPTTPNVCVFEDYYDIQVGPMFSRPVFLDPTQKSPKTIINALGTLLIEPAYDSDLKPVYSDLIEISGEDYEQVRHLGYRNGGKILSECYVVVQPKNTEIEKKYFSVTDFLSSIEKYDRNASAIITDEGKGALKITSIGTSDISQYKITIADTGSTSVTWGTDSLDIEFDGTSLDQIQDIIDATASGTPWATLANISAPSMKNAPEKNYVDFEDLDNYINAQTASGRYYQDTGKVWEWYDGYPTGVEVIGNERYGEWVESKSKFKYMIEVSGSLAYLGAEPFSLYLTTGKSYNVINDIIDLPYLTTGLEIEGTTLIKDTDFILNDCVVEFVDDIFVNKSVVIDSFLYCKKTPIIERYLFEQHGGMVGISEWWQYRYRNISGKAAINTLLSSLRNSSSMVEYEKALNIYYGLPVSPEKCRVVGLFESYGYKIISVSGAHVQVEIKSGEELHPFVQSGCIVLNSSGEQFVAVGIDRNTGEMTLVGDTSGLVYGDKLCVKLNNRFSIKNIYANSGNDAPYIDVYIREGRLPLQHVIDMSYNLYGKYPELIIHGTDKFGVDYNGLYHATKAETHPLGYPSIVRITLYAPAVAEEPLYNDYIETSRFSETGGTCLNDKQIIGFAHICWPTHKFLYLYMIDAGKFYRAYMDSPMDTIYDTTDVLEQYQVICKNASIFNGKLFSAWNQYHNFRKSPGINIQTDLIETIFANPSTKFGQYFPSGYIALE